MNKKIDHQKHINRISKIAPLYDKEMKILADLHILRGYKKILLLTDKAAYLELFIN